MTSKILFHREGLVVRLLELTGIGLSLIYFLRRPHVDFRVGLLSFLVVGYLFLRFCDLYPWAGLPRTQGIRVHFHKALVPMSYILTITSLFALLNIPILSTMIAFISSLMILALIPINGILIYFHLRDKDPLPINYFSSNAYLEGSRENKELQASVG